MIKLSLAILLLFQFAESASAQKAQDTISLADPTILYDQARSTYYLYGTGSPDGFPVYTSSDLLSWQREKRQALKKGNAYGTIGFWAPQVFKADKRYYMAYAANEHIAIAEAANPQGPFMQSTLHQVSLPGRQIDPYIFLDSDGKLYIYYVNLREGNRIYVARMKDDFSDVDSTTSRECLHAESGWENTNRTSWPVSEGPTVMKIKNLYYLFYSANDYRNIDYAVGYATSSSPTGPWTKYGGNPILSRANTGRNGSGHGDVFTAKDGKLYYVFHTHESQSKKGKRKTALIELAVSKSNPAVITVIPGSFRYLTEGLAKAPD